MAVVITSKFYQASAWKDISKVVFTSPNMVSPVVAGTRSHILPGEGDLGMWYEDTSNMYRIESEQLTTDTDYYNFISSTTTLLDLSLPSASVTVTGTTDNYEIFFGYVKEGVGCTAVGYDSLNMSTVVQDMRVKLEYSTEATGVDEKGYLNNVLSTTVNEPGDITKDVYDLSVDFDADDTHNDAWVVDVIDGIQECYVEIDLDKPYKITKIYMQGEYAYDDTVAGYHHKRFFGNYKIFGKLLYNDSWAELYDGANTGDVDATVFLSENPNYFRYYKILIENNTGLTGCDVNYYAMSALQFYIFEYDNTPTRYKPMYYFKENGGADVVYISDITDLGQSAYQLHINSTTGSGTLASGTELRGWGTLTSRVDFQTDDCVVFEATVGEAYNCRLTAWDDVTHSTTANELIQGDHVRLSALAFCSSNSKLTPSEVYDPINYVYGPVHNRILKGNTVYMEQNYYYGDFDLVYRFQEGVYGDFVLFKPMLYGIDSGISYGIHDYIITLHYSYT